MNGVARLLLGAKVGFDFFDSKRFESDCLLQIVVVLAIGFWILGFAHRDVYVFKDLARSDAQDAVTGFDKVVALASAVLAAEVIGEAEAGTELFGAD